MSRRRPCLREYNKQVGQRQTSCQKWERLGVSPTSCPQGLEKSGGFAAAFFLVLYILYEPNAECHQISLCECKSLVSSCKLQMAQQMKSLRLRNLLTFGYLSWSYWALLCFTVPYWVLLDITRTYWALRGWILLNITGTYWALPGWVLLGHIGPYWA